MLAKESTSATIRTVLLKKKSIEHKVGTTFVKKDTQELFVKAVILMGHFGVKATFRKVLTNVVGVFLHYMLSLLY